MSIINNAHPGSQIRLIYLIDRVLIRRKKLTPIARQELVETCRPDSLPNSEGAKKRFVENLDFWLEEGLWKEEDDNISALETNATEWNLPQRVLSLCVRQHASKDILQGNRIEPLFRTITTLLCQDQFAFQGQQRNNTSLETPADIAEAINSRLPDNLSINASNEANTLRDWGIFLGLLEPFGRGCSTDPTRAIRPYLPELFAKNKELPIRDVISALAQMLPMLDGGRYREVVEPLMEKNGWQYPQDNRVSASLSHALLRLEADHQFILDQPSDDSGSMALLNTDGLERFVGTVRYRGAM